MTTIFIFTFIICTSPKEEKGFFSKADAVKELESFITLFESEEPQSDTEWYNHDSLYRRVVKFNGAIYEIREIRVN